MKNELFLKRFDEEKLDEYLAKIASTEGWAENRLKHAARVLHILNVHGGIQDKDMRNKIKDVIAFLEAYDLD